MLLQRRWLAGHALAALFAAAFVALGVWQLARHHHKQQKVREARAAYAAPAPDIRSIASGPPPSGRVSATGTYDGAHEVVLRDRVGGNEVGNDVLTPLLLDDGTAVLVDRGFVPSTARVAAAPRGRVVVRGILRASRPLSSQDAVRSEDGRLSLPRVDLTRVPSVRPTGWIEAQYQRPPPGPKGPRLPEPPPPDHVNHLQYAIEWFLLAAIPVVGWPILCARVVRRRR